MIAGVVVGQAVRPMDGGYKNRVGNHTGGWDV